MPCQFTTGSDFAFFSVRCAGVVSVWIPMGHVDGVCWTSLALQMTPFVSVVFLLEEL